MGKNNKKTIQKISVEERLRRTAYVGRFGRTAYLWKSQIERVVAQGFCVTILKEVVKAHYLVHISWVQPMENTLAATYYTAALQNTMHYVPPFYTAQNYQDLYFYLRQQAVMSSFATVICCAEDYDVLLTKLNVEGFSAILIDSTLTPLYSTYKLYIDWSKASANSAASTLHSQAMQLAISEFV